MLSFYDLRASCLAVHALQGTPVGTGALHISFSTPKDNMGDKDAHQGTLPYNTVHDSSLHLCSALATCHETIINLHDEFTAGEDILTVAVCNQGYIR